MQSKTTLALILTGLFSLSACNSTKTIKPCCGPNHDTTSVEVLENSVYEFENNMQDTVHFAYDSSKLSQEATSILDKQAQWLHKNPNVKIILEGHTDERGTREYNLALGERRANAAKKYLESKNLSPSKIEVVSYGKEKPVEIGDTEKTWAKNRRVVTVVYE